MSTEKNMLSTFERYESEVRSYCRSFPTVFTRARGALLYDRRGEEYIDFFAGAGALNYGHNDPAIKERLLAYLADDGITHGLDMATEAKERFIETFQKVVLAPRGLDYKMMFPGPTGTNAVESALKLARKVTGRSNVIGFTNAFHGMTLGSLAVSGNGAKRAGAGQELGASTNVPFDGYLGEDIDTLRYLEAMLDDPSSGLDDPAAIILETIQAEGGVNEASLDWLRGVQKLARDRGILLIVDDIQVGCGRTGPFFSFEKAGLQPDIVCLSKSLSGYGLPLALVLMRPELDVFSPGEHNGTFRGHNPAFVTATAALETYWRDDAFERGVVERSTILGAALDEIADRTGAEVRGRGMIRGLAFGEHEVAGRISQAAFERGVIVETAGAHDEVFKFLPPLNIDLVLFEEGIDRIASACEQVFDEGTRREGLSLGTGVEIAS